MLTDKTDVSRGVTSVIAFFLESYLKHFLSIVFLVFRNPEHRTLPYLVQLCLLLIVFPQIHYIAIDLL